MRLAAWLRPDPLGRFSAPPDPLAAIGGGVPLLRGTEKRRRKGRRREKDREGRVRGGDCLLIV